MTGNWWWCVGLRHGRLSFSWRYLYTENTPIQPINRKVLACLRPPRSTGCPLVQATLLILAYRCWTVQKDFNTGIYWEHLQTITCWNTSLGSFGPERADSVSRNLSSPSEMSVCTMTCSTLTHHSYIHQSLAWVHWPCFRSPSLVSTAAGMCESLTYVGMRCLQFTWYQMNPNTLHHHLPT